MAQLLVFPVLPSCLNATVKDAVTQCQSISCVYDLVYKFILDLDRRRHSWKLHFASYFRLLSAILDITRKMMSKTIRELWS